MPYAATSMLQRVAHVGDEAVQNYLPLLASAAAFELECASNGFGESGDHIPKAGRWLPLDVDLVSHGPGGGGPAQGLREMLQDTAPQLSIALAVGTLTLLV